MIDYPVDVENTRWATWSISLAAIKKHNREWPREDGGPVVDQSPDIIPLLEVQEAQPAFDPATEHLVASTPVVDIEANTHTHGWTVQPLSQEDLDAIAERENALAQYDDMLNGVGNSTQRIVRLEKMLSYVFRVFLGAG
jgi:hypothetical protein